MRCQAWCHKLNVCYIDNVICFEEPFDEMHTLPLLLKSVQLLAPLSALHSMVHKHLREQLLLLPEGHHHCLRDYAIGFPIVSDKSPFV